MSNSEETVNNIYEPDVAPPTPGEAYAIWAARETLERAFRSRHEEAPSKSALRRAWVVSRDVGSKLEKYCDALVHRGSGPRRAAPERTDSHGTTDSAALEAGAGAEPA
jgi:hypothetical protein